MPIYEYVCDSCEHQFETIQKISEDPLKTCPECQKDALRKKVSAAAFRLKGGGWYETDFKSGNKRNIAGDGGKPSETSSESSKTDSKSDKSSTKNTDNSSNKKSDKKSSSSSSDSGSKSTSASSGGKSAS